jgi:hypothetical protein
MGKIRVITNCKSIEYKVCSGAALSANEKPTPLKRGFAFSGVMQTCLQMTLRKAKGPKGLVFR